MPSKKKKYNSRFPPARIKKIMQSDEEVGKVAQVVPIIISKALEIFVASLLRSSSAVTRSRNARTLTPNHIKTSILSDDQFHFLRELAQTIPDVNPGAEGEEEEGATTAGAGSTGSAPQMTPSVPRLQRKTSENRTTTTTSATITSSTTGHQLSASGQVAATGFRTRGRPRKRPLEPQVSAQMSRTISAASSTATTMEEPEDDEETEEESDEEDVEDEEDCQPLNSNNNVNRITSSSQPIISNINNNKNSFNYYYSSNTTHPSIATTESTTSQACSNSASSTGPTTAVATHQSMTASMVLKHQKPAIDEDDDYDN